MVPLYKDGSLWQGFRVVHISTMASPNTTGISDHLDRAIIEATFLFITGISRLYQSRLRSLREINNLSSQSHVAHRLAEGHEEAILVEDLRYQYEENVRVASACIEDLKLAARNFFTSLPPETLLQGEKAWSFFNAFCRSAGRGRTPRRTRCGSYSLDRTV